MRIHFFRAAAFVLVYGCGQLFGACFLLGFGPPSGGFPFEFLLKPQEQGHPQKTTHPVGFLLAVSHFVHEMGCGVPRKPLDAFFEWFSGHHLGSCCRRTAAPVLEGPGDPCGSERLVSRELWLRKDFVGCKSICAEGKVPSHQLTWKCTDPCRKTTCLLERAFLHFHDGWWEGCSSCGGQQCAS